MITIERSTPFRPTRTAGTPVVERRKAVDRVDVDKGPATPIPDRRKNRDRRRHNKNNVLLESRSGRDRRKNFQRRTPSIDVKA